MLSKTRRQRPFDPRSRTYFTMLCLLAVPTILALILTSFRVGTGPLAQMFLLMAWIAFSAMAARRYGLNRIAICLDALSLPTLTGCTTVAATVMLSAVAWPFADTALARADAAVGLDWLTLYRFYQEHRWLIPLSNAAYASLALQTLIVPLLLAATGHNTKPLRKARAEKVQSVRSNGGEHISR